MSVIFPYQSTLPIDTANKQVVEALDYIKEKLGLPFAGAIEPSAKL